MGRDLASQLALAGMLMGLFALFTSSTSFVPSYPFSQLNLAASQRIRPLICRISLTALIILFHHLCLYLFIGIITFKEQNYLRPSSWRSQSFMASYRKLPTQRVCQLRNPEKGKQLNTCLWINILLCLFKETCINN